MVNYNNKTNNGVHTKPVVPTTEINLSKFSLEDKSKQFPDKPTPSKWKQLEITMRDHFLEDDTTAPFFDMLSNITTEAIYKLHALASSQAVANGNEALPKPDLSGYPDDQEWYIHHFDNNGFVSWYEDKSGRSKDSEKYYSKLIIKPRVVRSSSGPISMDDILSLGK